MVLASNGGILPLFEAIACKSKITSASFHSFDLHCRHTHMAKYNIFGISALVMEAGPAGCKPGSLE